MSNIVYDNLYNVFRLLSLDRSRIPSEGYTTNASYSDTVLDKLSLEASQSSTESDVSAEHPKKKVSTFQV